MGPFTHTGRTGSLVRLLWSSIYSSSGSARAFTLGYPSMPTGTIENPDLKTILANFGHNYWNWSLWDFCKHTGLDPRTEHGQEKFMRFKAIGESLGQFDERLLGIIFSRPA